ncbi:hypothetical protein ACFE04_017003 [Oxalis oulophora]
MLTVTAKTLSPSPFLTNNPNSQSKFPTKIPLITVLHCKSHIQTERGLEFNTGDSFYRHESATGRDLGVLAAYLYKQSKGQLRVIDAMCGCGIRSLRYLVEAQADFVLANDANDEYRGVILGNLGQVERGVGDEKRWVVTHTDATRVLTEYYMQKDFIDFIDVDSFGSDTLYFRSAFSALKMDGLLYLTSTDGFSAGGHRPLNSLAAYGAYIKPMPYANEIGLRMLIGGAVREASALGFHVTPLFSYYSYHGPVFRVLFRVNRGKLSEDRDYGFISYCNKCGNSQAYTWDKLNQISCTCNSAKGSRSLVVSGPMWTGPLHSASYLTEMLNLAVQWEWAGNGMETSLEKLLKRMIEESDPRLSFGYIKMDDMGSRAKINTPALKTLMEAMQKNINLQCEVCPMQEGYATSRSHIAANAIKTNCPMTECIRIAKELQTIDNAENLVHTNYI